GRLIMAEECYFYLMASMRKMRMAIPLTYTLEFFGQLFQKQMDSNAVSDAIIHFFVYRKPGESLVRNEVAYYFQIHTHEDILSLRTPYAIDVVKEISVNANLLSGLHVHAPENIYAAAYAAENGMDDVILLNPFKRVARCIKGNLLLLQNDGTIR